MMENVVPWAASDGAFFDFAAQMSAKTASRDDSETKTTPEAAASPSPTAVAAPIIQAETQTATPDDKAGNFNLLALPVEIRLQIYQHVYAATPVRLTDAHHSSAQTAAYLQAVIPGLVVASGTLPTSLYETSSVLPAAKAPRRLNARRRLHALPTALLASCRRVYLEARGVPFAGNEFAFATSFAPGASAALAFSRRLAAWQRGALRWARVELPARALAAPAALAELCGLWADGVRGLRVRVDCAPGRAAGWKGLGGGEGPEPEGEAALGPAGEGRPWVREGLRRLTALRQLEVELAGSRWSDGEKVEWCRGLEAELNEGRMGEERVAVVCVEMAGERREVVGDAGERTGIVRISGLQDIEEELMSW